MLAGKLMHVVLSRNMNSTRIIYLVYKGDFCLFLAGELFAYLILYPIIHISVSLLSFWYLLMEKKVFSVKRYKKVAAKFFLLNFN